MNRHAFTAYAAHVLAPELAPANVIIMDNLSSHKAPIMRATTE